MRPSRTAWEFCDWFESVPVSPFRFMMMLIERELREDVEWIAEELARAKRAA